MQKNVGVQNLTWSHNLPIRFLRMTPSNLRQFTTSVTVIFQECTGEGFMSVFDGRRILKHPTMRRFTPNVLRAMNFLSFPWSELTSSHETRKGIKHREALGKRQKGVMKRWRFITPLQHRPQSYFVSALAGFGGYRAAVERKNSAR